MSWGERSCKIDKDLKNEYGGCKIAKIETCNVSCPGYKWDGKTKPDSERGIKLSELNGG